MSDLAESRALLMKYSIARIPFVLINTIEKGRSLDVLREVSQELSLSFLVHTMSKGVYDLVSGRTVSDEKTFWGAVAFMTEQMNRKQNVTMIFTDVPDLSTDSDTSKQISDLVNLANETGGMLMILSNQPVWNQLQRQGLIVTLDMPDESEMYGIIKEYIDAYRSEIPIEWDDMDIREAASLLAGVTKIEAENVVAALIANRRITKSDMDEVRSAKNRLYSDISGLEKIDVDDSVKEVGGLEGLQKWLQEKKELLTPQKRDILRAKGLRPPRGILLVGVPGCGKSMSAKSIAANWNLPLYRLDFATVQGSFVGQSEQQLRDALATAEAVSPCVLWIDEIEKGLSGSGSNDGGVSTRMVGQFLFWLQECKKQVFVVATANDVSMLPSELLRRGRFDELFFIDLPTADERRSILSLYMRKYLNLNFAGQFADEIVAMTEGFTGADLESTVRDLAYRKVANPAFELGVTNITEAFNNVVPLSQTSPEKIEAIRDWGKSRAVPASGKPIGDESLQAKSGAARRRQVLV